MTIGVGKTAHKQIWDQATVLLLLLLLPVPPLTFPQTLCPYHQGERKERRKDAYSIRMGPELLVPPLPFPQALCPYHQGERKERRKDAHRIRMGPSSSLRL